MNRAKGTLCVGCHRSIPWITNVYCYHCGRYEICGDCQRRGRTYLLRNRSAVEYDDAMKDLLARYKYRGDERLQDVFSEMIDHGYRMHLQDLRSAEENPVFHCVTFVPLSETRQLERGFNQAERLARVLAVRHDLQLMQLLKRVKHTEKQSFKTRQQRLDDLRGAFEADAEQCRKIRAIPNAAGGSDKLRILLVDDVYTTGSTLQECAKTILAGVAGTSYSIEIYGLCWAR